MNPFITGYCTIRNNGVMNDDRLSSYEENFVNFADFLRSLYKKEGLNYPKFFKMDGPGKLGFLTAELLLKQRNMAKYAPERIGLILSNSASSLDTDLAYFETIRDRGNYFPSPSVFVYTLPNIVNGEICIRHKFKGENTFLVTEAFNPGLLVAHITEAMGNDRMDACIAGWVEVLRDRYESLVFLVEKEPGNAGWSEELSREALERMFNKI